MWQKRIWRILTYVMLRVILVGVIIALIASVFASSVKTSNLYFIIQDAMKARLDIILSDVPVEDKAKFFSYNYLQSAEYEQLKSKYEYFEVSAYNHKFEFERLFVWPWQKKKTIIVKEDVYTIIGKIDTSKITTDEAGEKGINKIPQWEASEYRVQLMYENDKWIIDSVERVGDYDYTPPQTPSLSKEEIDALRTPQPSPAPTFNANEELTGEHPATISTPIRGDKVNVRLGPATQYEVIEELKNGAKITVLDESDGWYLVKTESGNEGYVSGYYILFD